MKETRCWGLAEAAEHMSSHSIKHFLSTAYTDLEIAVIGNRQKVNQKAYWGTPSDRSCYTKYGKNSHKATTKNNAIQKCSKDLNSHFSKTSRWLQACEKHSASFIIKEMWSKPQWHTPQTHEDGLCKNDQMQCVLVYCCWKAKPM